MARARQQESARQSRDTARVSDVGVTGPRFLRDLARPSHVFANLGPNWFASVMGTGIIATAGATLPISIPGVHTLALVFWMLATLFLVLLTIAWVVHWIKYRATAKKWINDPVLSQFYGAPPMAVLTVGLGALLIGKDIIGMEAALVMSWSLWIIGTIMGLGSAIIVPYVMFTRRQAKPEDAFGGWLMPLVPPMVSANAGAPLIGHLEGQTQLTMVLLCYAMFGISLIASIIVITLIWSRMVHHPMPAALLVPTLWIVLGPLGQSISAANNLGGAAVGSTPGPFDTEMLAFGLLYGVPVWGFAMFWIAISGSITIRELRKGLPFGLTWWSFTFPVGTVVTGTSALAHRSEASLFANVAVVLYAFLVFAWFIVFIKTAINGYRGRIFLPPAQAAALGQ